MGQEISKGECTIGSTENGVGDAEIVSYSGRELKGILLERRDPRDKREVGEAQSRGKNTRRLVLSAAHAV